MINYVVKILSFIIKSFGVLSGLSILLVVFFTVYDVSLRYFFNSGSIFMQELEWHFHAAVFLLGGAYAYFSDSHVRVDIFYSKFSDKKKNLIQIFSILFLLLPFALVVIWNSLDFIKFSYAISEGSPNPGGVPYRFIVKSLIPLSFALLVLESVRKLIQPFISEKEEIE